MTAAGNLGPAPGSITAPGQQKSDAMGAGDLLEPRGISDAARHGFASRKPDLASAQNVSFPLRAWEEAGRNMVKSGTSMKAPRSVRSRGWRYWNGFRICKCPGESHCRESAKRDLGLPRNRQGHGMLQTDRFLSLLAIFIRAQRKNEGKHLSSCKRAATEFMGKCQKSGEF